MAKPIAFDRSYCLPPLGGNPSTDRQGTTPGSFANPSEVGGPLTFSKAAVLSPHDAGGILEAAAEQNRDGDGLTLARSIAPFTVIVTPVHPERLEAARGIYQSLIGEGHGLLSDDVLLDDRDARPGVKFKDADLIGIPFRINVGKKLTDGVFEFVERNPKRSTDVPVGELSIPPM